MAGSLTTIKDRFHAFRAKHPNVIGKALRYPEELQMLLVRAKEEGHTFKELAVAAGCSEGGLNKMIDRHKKGHVTRRPGRPSKAEMGNGASVKKSASKLVKVAKGKKAKRGRPPKIKTAIAAKQTTASRQLKAAKAAKAIKAKKTKTANKVVYSAPKLAKAPNAVMSAMNGTNGTSKPKRGRPPKNAAPKNAAKGGIQLTIHDTRDGKEWQVTLSAKDAFQVFREMAGAA